jgi:hypothetical protein
VQFDEKVLQLEKLQETAISVLFVSLCGIDFSNLFLIWTVSEWENLDHATFVHGRALRSHRHVFFG